LLDNGILGAQSKSAWQLCLSVPAGNHELEARPRHFHSTTWHFVDATHLTQDWQIVEHGKEKTVVRMEFTRREWLKEAVSSEQPVAEQSSPEKMRLLGRRGCGVRDERKTETEPPSGSA
jgi:hypothetical protein